MFVLQQIPDFATLVSRCRLYKESMNARNAALKSVVPPGNSYGPQRNFGQGLGRGNPFNRNQKPYASSSRNQQRSFKPYNKRGFRQGNNKNKINKNNNNKMSSPVGNSNLNTPPWYSKCKGKHFSLNYLVCYHCNQPGHIKPMCPKLKREEVNIVQAARPKAKGRVFAMSRTEIEGNEDIIQVSLPYDIIVSTPTNEPVIVSTMCSHCPITLDERTFVVDVICLPLSQLDIILGMDWLFNSHVLLNCFNKTLIFSDPNNPIESCYDTQSTTANQLKELLKDGVQVFMLLSSLEKKDGEEIQNLPVVRNFSEVFPDDIHGLSPVREIEFAIDLVPRTGLISIAPYRMAPLELTELKKQLEDLLQKQFVRPSVSPWGVPMLFGKKKDGSI
ncbi:PREDICTED: uncharacterized protein LOC109363555 [Lupinus angustifolius]|uniref:uncharacterized protein LOC109363555 n=1 Tax=Lupinus angustifolius TaxID=3871 RepID=UPI00092F94C6|nr:PREDICTED: uncharacterized protein LOC109363555 [Lupinus angustifolius]